jgi:hypothetical protein
MSVKVAAKLPAGDRDGLRIAEGLLSSQHRPITVVATLYPRQISDVLDRPEDPTEVTCGILAIEALLGDAGRAGHELLATAYEMRTGQVALPLGDPG